LRGCRLEPDLEPVDALFLDRGIVKGLEVTRRGRDGLLDELAATL
jgi:hypothetical protein